MEAFEPPKYITSLIAAVNDGAKSAQLGALALTGIGLFLLATAFSASDEDLLLNRAITISQLGGTAVPVVFAFGLAPAVFVAVHFYTLIRYDMLAGNIRRFVKDLAAIIPLEADRDRCRQLLANVEFVNALVMPKRSRASSWMFNATVHALLAVFPIGVLLLVQLQSLRLQSEWVTWTHHACIFTDLVLLVWFFGRLRGDESNWGFWRVSVRRKAALCWIPTMVLAVDLLWLQVPGPNCTTVGPVHFANYLDNQPERSAPFMERVRWWASYQPVDLLLCTPAAWGCRFLTVTNRVVVAKVWDDKTFLELRANRNFDAKHRASFEGVSLRNRNLRFADLTGSEFFDGDFGGADLRNAHLSNARLDGADLAYTRLDGAYLSNSVLQDSSFYKANLFGADMIGTNLERADLSYAILDNVTLIGANLVDANLNVAHLGNARLDDANLVHALMTFAYLGGAFLAGANLDSAFLEVADLSGAGLSAARNLTQMQLERACGTDAILGPGMTVKPCSENAKYKFFHMNDSQTRISSTTGTHLAQRHPGRQ